VHRLYATRFAIPVYDGNNNDDDDVDSDHSDAGTTVSVRDRIQEFDVLFQPTPFYHLQRPSPWRASPDVAVSPPCSATHGQLPVKATVARYDGDLFRKQTPAISQVNNLNVCVLVRFNVNCRSEI